MTQVALAWMPILCSIEPQETAFRAPSEPSLFTIIFGTMNSDMPLVESGASGVLASTRWMMFSVRSCSPAEIKILVPVTAYEPSSCGTARVRIKPRSVPHCGSVRFMVPSHSLAISLGRYLACCSGEPLARMDEMAPVVRPGYIPKAWLAEAMNSSKTKPSTCGSPCPPNSSGIESVPQPASRYWSNAALKPLGVETLPSACRVQPS